MVRAIIQIGILKFNQYVFQSETIGYLNFSMYILYISFFDIYCMTEASERILEKYTNYVKNEKSTLDKIKFRLI